MKWNGRALLRGHFGVGHRFGRDVVAAEAHRACRAREAGET